MQVQDELARLHYLQKKEVVLTKLVARKLCSGTYQMRLLTKLLTEELLLYSGSCFLALLKIKQTSLSYLARTTAPSSFPTNLYLP